VVSNFPFKVKPPRRTPRKSFSVGREEDFETRRRGDAEKRIFCWKRKMARGRVFYREGREGTRRW
jgi:hypothetical protein